jgi:hypothetical protein
MTATVGLWHIARATPVAHGRAWDSKLPCDLRVVDPVGREGKCLLADRGAMHEHMFACHPDGAESDGRRIARR